jgi:hypothetical protein
MKAAKAKTMKEINWAIPGQTVSHDDFMASIRKAEKGPFMTIIEFKERFYKWRREKYQL